MPKHGIVTTRKALENHTIQTECESDRFGSRKSIL